MEPLSPSNIVFGKVMMWIAIFFAAVSIGAGIYAYKERFDRLVAEADLNTSKTQLNDIVGQLQQNYEDYQRRLGEANQTKVIVTKQYFNTIQTIEKGADQNESCDKAMRALDAAND